MPPKNRITRPMTSTPNPTRKDGRFTSPASRRKAADRAATPAAEPVETPYVVLLGGDVTTGDLSADNDSGLSFPVVVVRMTHAPYIDLGMQHDMNVAVLREDAIQLADAIKAAALSLPVGG